MRFLKNSSFILILLFCSNIYAEFYTCSIKNVSDINKNGYFVSHGWRTNYLNREFTIDRETGKVVNTTALKERLNNFDATHKPEIIAKDNNSAVLKVFTAFKENGTYSLFQMNDFDKENPKKPYFYYTSIGMILSGTCMMKEIKN